MKILLINNFHYRKGGSETVYFNNATLLKEAGHEIVFFSVERDENEETLDSKYFISDTSQFGRVKGVMKYFYNKEAAKKLEQLIVDEKPDIAHAHLMWGCTAPAIFGVLKKYHIPLVHTVHDYRMVCPAYTFKDGAGKMCERCKRWNYYQCAKHRCSKGSLLQSVLMSMEMYTRQLFFNPIKSINGFIFVSHFSEHKHISHLQEFEGTKHIILYNYTKPIIKPDFGDKSDYYLFFGRLSFEKGVPTLLKVFARHPELKLKVVGTGPLEDELKAEYPTKDTAPARALGKSEKCYENIQFLGYHSGGALAELVRSARYVCVPSECYENNPMTIIESYSYGTPVIGANIGGIPEIINEGETGYLFDPGDVDDFEQVLLEANSNSGADYQKMTELAYDFYKTHFSEECYAEKLQSFYNLVLNDCKVF